VLEGDPHLAGVCAVSVASALLDQVVQELKDEALELVPIAVAALQGLLKGHPPEQVLSHAERQALADYAQRRLDAALERGRGVR
jgi:hypothetical protein